jgi:hypothetical protein
VVRHAPGDGRTATRARCGRPRRGFSTSMRPRRSCFENTMSWRGRATVGVLSPGARRKVARNSGRHRHAWSRVAGRKSKATWPCAILPGSGESDFVRFTRAARCQGIGVVRAEMLLELRGQID